jgi:hypothetical protein
VPPGPRYRAGVHSLQRGPGAMPLSYAYLKRYTSQSTAASVISALNTDKLLLAHPKRKWRAWGQVLFSLPEHPRRWSGC